jgi:hypothetical protein
MQAQVGCIAVRSGRPVQERELRLFKLNSERLRSHILADLLLALRDSNALANQMIRLRWSTRLNEK